VAVSSNKNKTGLLLYLLEKSGAAEHTVEPASLSLQGAVAAGVNSAMIRAKETSPGQNVPLKTAVSGIESWKPVPIAPITPIAG
jgi:hypothetical protein